MTITHLDVASGTTEEAGVTGYEYRLRFALAPDGASTADVDAACASLSARLSEAVAQWQGEHGIAAEEPPRLPAVVFG